MSDRDPTPGASFNETPGLLGGAYWAMRGDIRPRGHRRSPDLFDRLRVQRLVTIRLVVGLTAITIGLGLLLVVPALGIAVLLLASWSVAIDLLLLSRLRRSVAEAWVDLARPPE